MTSTTDPTVPLPTATDIEDDDDRDDEVSSSLLPSQPPTETPPGQLTVSLTSTPLPGESATRGVSSAPGGSTTAPAIETTIPSASRPPSASNNVPSPSATELADSLSGASPTALNPAAPANDGNSDGNGLSSGVSAGIGIGVALIVCLAAFGTWFFLRRRNARRTNIRSTPSRSSDEEHASQKPKSEIYAYCVGGPVEVSGDDKPGRWSELESPTFVAELGDGQMFCAELPGCALPVAVGRKGGGERLFMDAPIDEVDEAIDLQQRNVDKKDERLFSDPPIDEDNDTLDSRSKYNAVGRKT